MICLVYLYETVSIPGELINLAHIIIALNIVADYVFAIMSIFSFIARIPISLILFRRIEALT